MTSSEALLSDARHGDSRAWTPQLWAILIVLGGALCLDALDVSMIGVALPSIRTALGLSTASLQWIVSGYVLGYGGLLLLGGRAADLLGRRRVFLIALAVFVRRLQSAFENVVAQCAVIGCVLAGARGLEDLDVQTLVPEEAFVAGHKQREVVDRIHHRRSYFLKLACGGVHGRLPMLASLSVLRG